MNKLDRVIMIEQDLEGYNNIELAIYHFVQARKISLDVNRFQEREISLIALNVRLHSSSLRGVARRRARSSRGGTRLVGGGSWIVGARRWRVASLREGPLRLDLHLE
ncbi:hypothetical protein Taro_014192, partial [Colocasia esculenta]|nr:hypothetical protein [Colocasia esculenta]